MDGHETGASSVNGGAPSLNAGGALAASSPAPTQGESLRPIIRPSAPPRLIPAKRQPHRLTITQQFRSFIAPGFRAKSRPSMQAKRLFPPA